LLCADLRDAANPTLAQLIAGWTQTPTDLTSLLVTHGQSLINYFESVAAAVGKPLVFTELGYENATDAASSPAGSHTNIVNSSLQAELYQAFFQAWLQAGNTSLTGVYFWNWDPNAADVGPGTVNFSPQGLPAQDVVTNWFSGLLAQIQQFYSEIEYRPPPGLDPATVNAYLALSPTQIVKNIEAEPYTQNTVNPVVREYQAAFGSVPDQGGAAYWTQQFGTGAVSLAQISLIFASSQEFSHLYGGAGPNTPANTTLVTAFYQNVLQRAPDAGGLAYWVGTGLPAYKLLQDFAQSAEFINNTNQPIINFQNLEAAGTPVTTGSLFAVPDPPASTTLVGDAATTAAFASLNFIAPGDSTALGYSTNAKAIDASNSGGVVMQAGDANFATAATVAGSIGDVFKGSITAGDVLGGSIGNDTFTLQQTAAPETIYTGGGADAINLAANHKASDHIEFYAGSNTAGVTPGGVENVTAASITDGADKAQLGWWGLPTGGAAAEFGAVGAATGGVSLDMSTVQNLNISSDILDFGVAAWGTGTNPAGGVNHGLTNGDMTTHPLANTSAAAQQVTVGLLANAGDTLKTGTNLIELAGGAFANAAAVANALSNPATSLFFAAPLSSNGDAHMLLAYNNGSGGTVIADVDFAAPAGGAASSGATAVHVSDIVKLTGVSFASFAANSSNVHFV
jgi:hypothetical protein